MYQPMLFLHWKQIRWVLIPFVIASFGLPLLAVDGLGTPVGMDTATLDAYRFVSEFPLWLPLFPVLAGLIGMTLGLSAWNWDHQLKHVYALSLPVGRSEYTMLKMGAGITLALLPTVGLWLGAHLAAASISLPTGLQAYPNALALRFFFAIVISYAVLFAMAAGTVKTTLWVTSVALGFVLLGNVANDLLALQFELFTRINMVQVVWDWVVSAPGPFEVFTGNWALIDV